MRDKKTVELEARRRFLKNVGAAAVTVPAAALLLSAASTPTLAQNPYESDGGGSGGSRSQSEGSSRPGANRYDPRDFSLSN